MIDPLEISGFHLKEKHPNNVILHAAIMSIMFDLLRIIN